MSGKDENIVEKFDKNMRANKGEGDALRWYSPDEEPFHIAGFAWRERGGKFRRMPLNPSWPLPEAVDRLADHTAGGQIRFRTDSRVISVKVKLSGPAGMNHMPSTGQCGFDGYVGRSDAMIFCNASKFPVGDTAYECRILDIRGTEAKAETCSVVLNFPLYQGVEEVRVGLEEQAAVLAPPAYVSRRKVIIYGTSITQGGCASRPGMAYTNILSRRIPLEFINLGFSGNGRGEPEVARILSEIAAPACLVLDYEANCVSTENYFHTLPEFIRIYREKHPETPILLVSQTRRPEEFLLSSENKDRLKRLDFQKEQVHQLREKGDRSLYFYDGTDLLGGEDFHECTVDGAHPTDLGFLRMADRLTPVLRSIVFP